MSKPRYGWWSYAKYMIRRYPDLLEKYTRLHETKITPNLSGMPGGGGTSNPTEKAALKELTPIEQKEFDAVHSAVMETGRMKTGADRIKVVKLVLWDRSHTLTGAAYGLNLQNGGHHIIWFGLVWSLEQYEQANKRLHRQGQKHPVVIHHLVVQGGMDEDVITALQRKGDTQEALMAALKARIKKAKEGAA